MQKPPHHRHHCHRRLTPLGVRRSFPMSPAPQFPVSPLGRCPIAAPAGHRSPPRLFICHQSPGHHQEDHGALPPERRLPRATTPCGRPTRTASVTWSAGAIPNRQRAMAPPLPPVAPQRFRGNRGAFRGESAPRGGTGTMARDPKRRTRGHWDQSQAPRLAPRRGGRRRPAAHEQLG